MTWIPPWSAPNRLGAPIDTSHFDAELDRAFDDICDGVKTRAERRLKALMGFPVTFKKGYIEFTGSYYSELFGGPEIVINFPEECARACHSGKPFDEWTPESCRAAFKAAFAHEYIHYQQDYRSGGMFIKGYKGYGKGGADYRKQIVELTAFAAMAARNLRDAGIKGLSFPPQQAAIDASPTVASYSSHFDTGNLNDEKVLRRFVREVNLRLYLKRF